MANLPARPARLQLIKIIWNWLAYKNKLLHDSISHKYPKAALRVDNALVVIVDKFLSHPLFGIILFLILGVLALVGGDKLILISIFAAWAVAFLWVARSETIKKLTIFSRLAVLSVAAVVLGLVFEQFGAWAISEYQASKDSEKIAREHLQVSRNYQKDRNAAKALEYALKAYQADKNSPEVLFNLAYAYLVQTDQESFLKAREVLVANSHRLDVTGKATLGVAEYKLNKFGAAFHALGPLNLNDCNEDILPWAVIALAGSAFETLPYKDALLKMKDGLVVLDRRIALYDLRASVSGSNANLTVNHYRWYRLRMAKFYVGGLWLAKAYDKKATQEMIDAIRMASEGMVLLFKLIPRENILRYLAWINEIIDEGELIKTNPSFILETLDGYKKTLNGAKNKYPVELVKLELFRNCLVDVHSSPEDKRPVQLTHSVEFTVDRLVTSDTNLRTIMMSRNFAIKNPVQLAEDKLPVKKVNIKHTIKLAKNDFFDRAENFAFGLSVQDSSGNETNKTFCPNFFANQVNG